MRSLSPGVLILTGLASGILVAVFGVALSLYALDQCAGVTDPPNTPGLGGFVRIVSARFPCLVATGHWFGAVVGISFVVAAVCLGGFFLLVARSMKA
jgi:hypothetical protein